MNSMARQELVAACGLYCGECHRYKKGKCPGCADNVKASWCKVRTCTAERGYRTCAECRDFPDVQACRKFNTIFSKFFALVFRSDRQASLQLISTMGIEGYASEMTKRGLSVVKRQ